MYNNMIPFGHNRLFDLFDSFDQELLPTMTGSFRTDILASMVKTPSLSSRLISSLRKPGSSACST